MPIADYTTLLEKMLNGDEKALQQWHEYRYSKSLNKKEAEQTLQAIKAFYSSNAPDKRHALYLHAKLYDRGEGVQRDRAKAVRLYEEAIELGSTSAMNARASLYLSGHSPSPWAYAKATELYEKAVRLGNTTAMNILARMHYNNRNKTAAIMLYEQAIKLDNTTAMIERAAIHMADREYTSAIAFYEQATKLGDTFATCCHAKMYLYGDGVSKNYTKAITLYGQAAQAGSDLAERILKDIHANEFNELSKQLYKLKAYVKSTHTQDKKPSSFSDIVDELHRQLESARKNVKKKPTIENYQKFYKFCDDQLNKAISELEPLKYREHRGWHAVHPIIKGIMGILAIITILPALTAIDSKQGYLGTFFKTPKTTTSQEIDNTQKIITSKKALFENPENDRNFESKSPKR